MVDIRSAPLVAASATPLLRLLVLIAGAVMVGYQIYQEATKDRAPKDRAPRPTPPPSRTMVTITRFTPREPNLEGLQPTSSYNHLDFFIRVLERGMDYFEYCDLSLKNDSCENLKDSKRGREAKEGLYCPPDGESCILMQTALPNGTLERFIDDWHSKSMENWEFCASRKRQLYCGAIFSNFSRSNKYGLMSPKRRAEQQYLLTIYTVFVSVRENTYPPPENKTRRTDYDHPNDLDPDDFYYDSSYYQLTQPNIPLKMKCVEPKVKPPPKLDVNDLTIARNIYRNMDYWQYNRKYWFILVLFALAFVGTFYEMAVVSWFVWMYLNETADFHKWTKFQYVVIGVNYTFAATLAMVLTQDIPNGSITIWIAVLCVSMIISTVSSSLFVYWANKKHPRSSVEADDQEAIQ